MTSNTETTNFDMNFVDLLWNKFSEEKKAHEETILQLLSAQAQAQTAEAEAAKAKKLGLRAQAQEAQGQVEDAQTKIKDLEGQMAQMRLSEQSQAQSAIEAQEEVRSLRAQAQESQKAHAETQESLAQELETARAKIASLEAAVAKARAAFAESEVATSPDLTAQDQAQELKAAQVKIENLEAQMAQMKLFEHFQAQAEELKAALAKITDLEAQIAQSEKQAQEKICLLRSDIQGLRAQTQELEAAQAQVKELESQVAQDHEENRSLRAQTEAQAQELKESQAKICSLEAQVPEPPAPAPAIMCERYTVNREYFNQYFCIVQNGIRLYLQRMDGCEVFTKFVPKQDATLELVPGYWFKLVHRVSVSDGQDWVTIGHITPDNNKLLIGSPVWSWVTKRTPARINADGNELNFKCPKNTVVGDGTQPINTLFRSTNWLSVSTSSRVIRPLPAPKFSGEPHIRMFNKYFTLIFEKHTHTHTTLKSTLKLDQAREEIRGLRAQTQEAQAKIKELEAQVAQMRLSEQYQAQTAIEAQEEVRSLRAQAQELETARAKIASLEARMVKARAFFAEIEVETNPEPRDQTQELKAAQVKIESLEVQMARMKVVEQFQSQVQELSVAYVRITELEAQIAQSEQDSQEKICSLNSEIRNQKAQAQELEVAQAKIKDLETQMAQAVIETKSQAQKLQEAQTKICSLEAQVPKRPAPAIMCERYSVDRQSYFFIAQNGLRLYLQRMDGCEVFTKFVPKRNATLELVPGLMFSHSHRVTVSDGQDWKLIGFIGPENKTILLGSLVWSWVTKRTPARINADGNEEYQLAICVDI